MPRSPHPVPGVSARSRGRRRGRQLQSIHPPPPAPQEKGPVGKLPGTRRLRHKTFESQVGHMASWLGRSASPVAPGASARTPSRTTPTTMPEPGPMAPAQVKDFISDDKPDSSGPKLVLKTNATTTTRCDMRESEVTGQKEKEVREKPKEQEPERGKVVDAGQRWSLGTPPNLVTSV